MPAISHTHAAAQPPRLAAPAMLADWAQPPSLAQTMLLVEDSRLAAEAVRLICRRLGVRLRRADSLEMAQAHLRVYRPDVVLVDPGLPDGSGLSLIAELGRPGRRPRRIVGFSGDPAMDAPCRRAGADAFIAKPLSPARHLPALFGDGAARAVTAFDPAPAPAPQRASGADAGATGASDRGSTGGAGDCRQTGHPATPPGTAPVCGARAVAALPPAAPGSRNHGADPLALQDDLRRAHALLSEARGPGHIGYAARFLGGIARCAGDAELMRAAERALASGSAAPLLAALDGRMQRNLDCI